MKFFRRGENILVILIVVLSLVVAAVAVWRGSAGWGISTKIKKELAEAKKAAEDLGAKVKELELSLSAKEQAVSEAVKKAEEAAKLAEEAKNREPEKTTEVAAVTLPSDWMSVKLDPLSLNLRYPKEWGKVQLVQLRGEKGSGVYLVFGPTRFTAVSVDFVSADFVGEGAGSERYTYSKSPQTCSTAKTESDISFERCQVYKIGDRVFIAYYHKLKRPSMTQGEPEEVEENIGYFYTGDAAYPAIRIAASTQAVALETIVAMLASIK